MDSVQILLLNIFGIRIMVRTKKRWNVIYKRNIRDGFCSIYLVSQTELVPDDDMAMVGEWTGKDFDNLVPLARENGREPYRKPVGEITIRKHSLER
jgi:hypothetical protein